MINGVVLHRWVLPLLSAAVLFGLLLFVFPFDTGYATERSPLGFALWHAWTVVEAGGQDYSYCLLVPLIVGYLVFERKEQIARAPIEGRTWAIGLVILALFVFWVGSKAGKQYLGCGGIQLLLAGTILWFWGTSVFRLLLFAWGLLTFAWPLPFIDSTVALPLRYIVCDLAYHALNFLGIDCIRNGTAILSAAKPVISLPLGARFQIGIEDPCSGLHSLLALLMFSALYSYFFLPKMWQQWVVFLSAVPLTIIGNVVRIILLVIGCLNWGSLFALGTNDEPSKYHEGCGFAVFAVVLGLEFALGYILVTYAHGRAEGAEETDAPATGSEAIPPVEPEPQDIRAEVPLWREYAVLALAGIMVAACLLRPPPGLPPEAGVMMELPDQVIVNDLPGGHFSGTIAPVTDVEHQRLPSDTTFCRKNYDDFHGHEVYFSIVLSGKQQYTIHPPEVCLVAQGWKIVGQEDMPIHLQSGHDMMVHNLAVIHEGLDADHNIHIVRSYFMYWYVADGISTSSHLQRNLLSSWDRVVLNRDHRWAYVFAMSPITDSLRSDGLNAKETREMLAQFIQQIVPAFQRDEMTAPDHS